MLAVKPVSRVFIHIRRMAAGRIENIDLDCRSDEIRSVVERIMETVATTIKKATDTNTEPWGTFPSSQNPTEPSLVSLLKVGKPQRQNSANDLNSGSMSSKFDSLKPNLKEAPARNLLRQRR